MLYAKSKKFTFISIILLLSSLFFPFWVCIMVAPTYPEGLRIDFYGDRLEGDIREWSIISNLVGINIPTNVPEIDMKIIPLIILSLSAIFALSFFSRKWLKISVIVSLITLSALSAWTQYRLYLIGHNLDETAPLRNLIEPFTPPIIGWIDVGGSITVYHLPHIGSTLVFFAIVINLLIFIKTR